jgi:hypothetical protein
VYVPEFGVFVWVGSSAFLAFHHTNILDRSGVDALAFASGMPAETLSSTKAASNMSAAAFATHAGKLN